MEPGEIRAHDWAHVRWGGHHLVIADEPEVDRVQPIRVACGKRFERSRIWHDPPSPHLPKCKGCELHALTTDQLQQIEAAYRAASLQAEQLRTQRNELVRQALAAGWTHARISEATGLSRGRIGQIAHADQSPQ